MNENLTKSDDDALNELADRCMQDLERLGPKEAVWKYPLLALVVAKVLPSLSAEELAAVVSVAAHRGLVDASQQCRGCAQEVPGGGGKNLCERCYERVLGQKFSGYA